MIILKTSNFIFLITLIIICSISIYIVLFPNECNCKSKIKKNINIYRGRIKYIPIIISNSKKINKKNEIEMNKDDNKKKKIKKYKILNKKNKNNN